MTALPLSLSQDQTLAALRSFLLAVLPAGIVVRQAQANRVAEPPGDFVLMTPLLRSRLATNIDGTADLAFTGSIAATTLTVTAMRTGAIAVGAILAGAHVATNTAVTALGSGTGGVGTYTVSPSQTASSGLIWGGSIDLMQPTQLTVQLDVHGPASADNAQVIATVFRDDYAVEFFAGFSPAVDVTPLYAGEPRQLPFANEQQQIEYRWVIDAVLQVNPVLAIPQQFADTLTVGLIDVDANYPP